MKKNSNTSGPFDFRNFLRDSLNFEFFKDDGYDEMRCNLLNSLEDEFKHSSYDSVKDEYVIRTKHGSYKFDSFSSYNNARYILISNHIHFSVTHSMVFNETLEY